LNSFVNFELFFLGIIFKLKVTWRWLLKTKLGTIYKGIQNDGMIKRLKNHALECKLMHDLKQTWWILEVMFEMMLEEIWLCNFSKMCFRRWFTLPCKNYSKKGMSAYAIKWKKFHTILKCVYNGKNVPNCDGLTRMKKQWLVPQKPNPLNKPLGQHLA